MPRFARSFFCLLVTVFSLQASLRSGEWIELFDGSSLSGWTANENPETWKVVDGAIVANGQRSHLFYTGDEANRNFRNFELEVEVLTQPGSNSGIYVHTRFQDEGWPAAGYELQVLNSAPPGHGGYEERKMTGSIYAIRNAWQSPAQDGQWFTYRIRVVGKTLQTFVDDVLICEYTEPESPWRPDDKQGRLLGEGTFALQGHDPGSTVRYRKMRVRIFPDEMPDLAFAQPNAELETLIVDFSNSNHPLIFLCPVALLLEEREQISYLSLRYGITVLPLHRLASASHVHLVNDQGGAINVEQLRSAKQAGVPIAFLLSDLDSFSEERLVKRLQAMKAAELGWRDLWVPGAIQASQKPEIH